MRGTRSPSSMVPENPPPNYQKLFEDAQEEIKNLEQEAASALVLLKNIIRAYNSRVEGTKQKSLMRAIKVASIHPVVVEYLTYSDRGTRKTNKKRRNNDRARINGTKREADQGAENSQSGKVLANFEGQAGSGQGRDERFSFEVPASLDNELHDGRGDADRGGSDQVTPDAPEDQP